MMNQWVAEACKHRLIVCAGIALVDRELDNDQAGPARKRREQHSQADLHEILLALTPQTDTFGVSKFSREVQLCYN